MMLWKQGAFSTAHFCVRAIKRRIASTTDLNHNDKITHSQTVPTTYRILIMCKSGAGVTSIKPVLLGHF